MWINLFDTSTFPSNEKANLSYSRLSHLAFAARF
jgi:hypothetical protein